MLIKQRLEQHQLTISGSRNLRIWLTQTKLQPFTLRGLGRTGAPRRRGTPISSQILGRKHRPRLHMLLHWRHRRLILHGASRPSIRSQMLMRLCNAIGPHLGGRRISCICIFRDRRHTTGTWTVRQSHVGLGQMVVHNLVIE